jgi:thiamine-phosphate pyrophosphorylase
MVASERSRERSKGRTAFLACQTLRVPAARPSLADARLYLVCAAEPARHSLAALVEAAIDGGVDVFQLREKELPDDQLVPIARAMQELCSRLGALFVVNDRPHVALEAGADGVHVGQDDMPPHQVREIVGERMLLGLSTHAPAEIDAVDPALVDYVGVGPVHATPTKLGRPAVGLELVRYAAEHARVPFFAIGGIDEGNVADVRGAGAERVCVLRAVADAADPRGAARSLRERLTEP